RFGKIQIITTTCAELAKTLAACWCECVSLHSQEKSFGKKRGQKSHVIEDRPTCCRTDKDDQQKKGSKLVFCSKNTMNKEWDESPPYSNLPQQFGDDWWTTEH
ncbi:hypothetical protein ILYODFUR_026850, partial [Ilyodon furcidens]